MRRGIELDNQMEAILWNAYQRVKKKMLI